ncbi:uncharacterized protein METZ01_LOCUS462680, partial [marine metagenome]
DRRRRHRQLEQAKGVPILLALPLARRVLRGLTEAVGRLGFGGMAETEEIAEGMKRCSQCGEVKPATAAYFDKKKSVQSGLTAQCKSCISEKNKKYNEANKEKIAEAGRKYYAANREKIAEAGRKYREANREKIAEKDKKYREANPEKFREKHKKYREANREKIREKKKEWHAANREKIAEKRKKWHEAAAARVRAWLRPRKSPRG